MKLPVNVRVVGCGCWGPNLARNLRGLVEGELFPVCDASAGRLHHRSTLGSGNPARVLRPVDAPKSS